MGNNIINSSKNGMDIYLYMDLSVIEADIHSADWGTKYVYGRAIRGWTASDPDHRCVEEYRRWIRTAYLETVRIIVGSLNLKDNLMAVSIMGLDPYLICDLTNDRDALMNCIDVREFVLSNDSDGSIYVNNNSCGTFNPYEEICKNAKQNKTQRSKRKAVGIVIIQSVEALYHFSSTRAEIEQSVKECEAEGIELIAIGVRNADANHKKLIIMDEVKAFSTNKRDSIVCDYETMLRHLRKIVEEKGGPIDYWWEATHTRDWEECIKFLREGYSKGDALCANEYGKLYYYGIYALEIRQKKYLVRSEDAVDQKNAKECFEAAAEKGVAEAKIFLENGAIPEDSGHKFAGVLISQIEIFDKQTYESLEKENEKKSQESKALSVVSMVMGIIFLFSKVSFVLLGFAVLGLVLGIKGRKKGGSKYAIVGIILNLCIVLVCVISIFRK